jgi:two-component system, sensor histidine kinase ChiS
VDDNDINLFVLRRILEHDGYTVVISKSGREALELMERECEDPVHMILCDLMMPEMNGLDVVRRLRLQWTAFQLPVLMVTAKVCLCLRTHI